MKTGKYILLNLVLMVAVAAGLVYGVLAWLDSYTRHGEAVTVPNIENMTLAQGVRELQKIGLEGVVSDSIYIKDKTPGIILDMNPDAGSRVKERRSVYITVNTNNIPLVVLPDVIDNSSARQARALFLASGFKLTENELVPGERDWVYGVKYNERELELNDRVPIGATLTLVVGSGEREMVVDSLASDSLDFVEAIPHKSSVDNDSWF